MFHKCHNTCIYRSQLWSRLSLSMYRHAVCSYKFRNSWAMAMVWFFFYILEIIVQLASLQLFFMNVSQIDVSGKIKLFPHHHLFFLQYGSTIKHPGFFSLTGNHSHSHKRNLGAHGHQFSLGTPTHKKTGTGWWNLKFSFYSYFLPLSWIDTLTCFSLSSFSAVR